MGILNASKRYYQFNTWKLGTRVNITFESNPLFSNQIKDSLSHTLDYYEEKYSPRIESEENIVHRIRQAEPGERIPLDNETLRMLTIASHVSRETSGAFDITVSPLLELWGIQGEPPDTKPSEEEIKEVLETVGFENLKIKEEHIVKKAPLTIDLGGIAKGYIIDQLANTLSEHGSSSFHITIGGDIYLSGENLESRDGRWTIGLQDPFHRDELMGMFKLSGEHAITTSGSYERYVKINGQRYGHIIDPRDGYPVNDQRLNVTVLAPSTLLADIWSTAFFVLGPEHTAEIISRYPQLDIFYLYINENHELAFFRSPSVEIDFIEPYYVSRETYEENQKLYTGKLQVIEGALPSTPFQGE